MAGGKDNVAPSPVVSHLKDVLLELSSNPFPEVANPPGAERRASVAFIIRIQPNYAHWPPTPLRPPKQHGGRRRSSVASDSSKLSLKDILNAFFEQDWVKHGDPEVLFIKRSTRKGDRWTGHVALPGGRRDPEDEDDRVTAVREAMEEVGIDLSYAHALAIGNLPQRVVTTSWGKVPLMVLCPYVFLLTHHDISPLRLQPTEVASAHWVSIRALLSPEQRTYEYQDISNRLAKQEMGIRRRALRAMLGQMLFAAINLVPSESLYCSSIAGFVSKGSADDSSTIKSTLLSQKLLAWWRNGRNPNASSQTQRPLLLWGLTLGVVTDFLELLPPHSALELWMYPTFTSWDVRFTLWLMAYSFRKQKQHEVAQLSSAVKATTVDGKVDDAELPESNSPSAGGNSDTPAEVGIGGLGSGLRYDEKKRQFLREGAVGTLLDGYYDIVRKAIPIALTIRLSLVAILAVGIWKYRGDN